MRIKGPWTKQQAHEFLAETRVPLRIACNAPSGFPVLASLWFVSQGDTLWCATQRTARIARLLASDPRCAFEVAPEDAPYRGVRGQATVTLHDDRGQPVLRDLIARYLDDADSRFARWLRARAETETAISIAPRTLISWDFRRRMGRAT